MSPLECLVVRCDIARLDRLDERGVELFQAGVEGEQGGRGERTAQEMEGDEVSEDEPWVSVFSERHTLGGKPRVSSTYSWLRMALAGQCVKAHESDSSAYKG